MKHASHHDGQVPQYGSAAAGSTNSLRSNNPPGAYYPVIGGDYGKFKTREDAFGRNGRRRSGGLRPESARPPGHGVLHRLHFRMTARWLRNWPRGVLHLHRNMRMIQSSSHLVYWLRKVATHRCIDQTRRRKLRPSPESGPSIWSRAPSRRHPPLTPSVCCRSAAPSDCLPTERSRMIVICGFQED